MTRVPYRPSLTEYQIGDVIESPRFGYQHVGLVIGQYDDGCWAVLTATPSRGTHHTRLCEFAAKRPVRIRHRWGRQSSQDKLLRRMQRVIGRPYSPLRWNCEHVVSYALGLEPESPQIRTWLAAGFATSIVGLAVASADRTS